MIQEITDLAAQLCLKFEGVRLSPYLCPAGIPTIGVGATFYEDGTRVTLKDPPITYERAVSLLKHTLSNTFVPAAIKLCPNLVSTGQLTALADFAFNLGVGSLRVSTLRRKINEGQWKDVPREFRKWVKGGGKVLRGLQLRREAEIKLFGVSDA